MAHHERRSWMRGTGGGPRVAPMYERVEANALVQPAEGQAFWRVDQSFRAESPVSGACWKKGTLLRSLKTVTRIMHLYQL